MAMSPPTVRPRPARAARVAPVGPGAGDGPPLDPGPLRELRVVIQNLQKVLAGVRSGQIALRPYAPYVTDAMTEVGRILGGLGSDERTRPLVDAYGLMRNNPLLAAPAADFTPQDQLAHLTLLDDLCHDIVRQVGFLTIPQRLNDWLATARPGYYVPFHQVFADELPVAEDRVELLQSLAWAPNAVQGGLVELSAGLVYRYSRDHRERLVGYAVLALAVLATLGAVLGAAWLPLPGWPFGAADAGRLLSSWVAIVVGVGAHVVIATAKRTMVQSDQPPVLALGDLPLWVNAKQGQLILKLLTTLVALFLLAFGAGATSLTVTSAFLAGYSLDSIVELVSGTLEQRATAQMSTLKQQLGVMG